MSEINTTMIVKRINIELVKATLKNMKTATKPEVAKVTGLSVMTCGTILNELLVTGEVLELEIDPSSGGRPAIRYQYNADYAQIACLYARTEGKDTFLSYQVCNLLGECLEEDSIYHELINYEVYETQLEELMSRYPQIKAAGIGVQGVVNQGVIGECDIKDLEGLSIESKLKDKFNIEIIAQNDMNLITYGYYHHQEDEKDENMAYIYFPEDNYIGAGMVVRGQVVKGKTNFAGELSFLPFGISRDKQIEQFNHPQTMISLVAQSIASITAVINPALILLAGRCVREGDLLVIQREVEKIIPKQHMPRLIYRQDIHDDYMNGLKSLTLNQMSYQLKLVKKQF